MRVVRDAEGHVVHDPTGKRAGRGAYLCHSPACWEQALKRGGLERALRLTALPADERAALEQLAQGLSISEDAGV
jgi:predicted RNA-binding protein YlxR (DUF448 family)